MLVYGSYLAAVRPQATGNNLEQAVELFFVSGDGGIEQADSERLARNLASHEPPGLTDLATCEHTTLKPV